ncbi:unnamed protein product [Calypogeia fissa]
MATCQVTSAALALGNPTDQLMQSYRPPTYSPPYPVKVHPRFSSSLFREKFEKWLEHHKVDTIFSPKIYQMLLNMDIPALAARVYTEASDWGLEWGCKFYFMLWIWDDTTDSTEIGKSPETAISALLDVHLLMMWSFPDDPVLRSRMEPFLNHFEGQAREEKIRYIESVLEEARTQPGTVYSKPTSSIRWEVYRELWKDMIAHASPEFCLRLAHVNQLWFLGCLEEAENRHMKTVPSSIDEYILMRRGSSAVIGSIAIVDIVYGLNTPDTLYYTPEFQSVLDAYNDILSWHNDLWSFKREVLVEKDISNMVLLISVHRKVSYMEAAAMTLQMLYDRIADFERSAKDLEAVTPPEYRHNVEVYLTTCKNFISGTEDWHSHSVRYQ